MSRKVAYNERVRSRLVLSSREASGASDVRCDPRRNEVTFKKWAIVGSSREEWRFKPVLSIMPDGFREFFFYIFELMSGDSYPVCIRGKRRSPLPLEGAG